MHPVRFTLVRCSIDPSRLAQSDEGYAAAFGREAYQSIVIRDATSVAEGYNRALAQAAGRYVILSHDDAWPVSPGAIERLVAHLEEVDIVGVAGADAALSAVWLHAGHPHLHGHILGPADDGCVNGFFWGADASLVRGIKLLDGCLLAARTDVALDVRFDEVQFNGFHCYDADFCFRANRAGRSLGVAADVTVYHLSGGDFGAEWQRYNERFLKLHGPDLDSIVPGPQQKASGRFLSVHEAAERIDMRLHSTIAERLRPRPVIPAPSPS